MNFIFNSIFILSFIQIISSTVAVAYHSQCVLDNNGHEICNPIPLHVNTAVRMSLPCEKDDMACWCMKAVEYTNAVRRRHGVSKPLKVGPVMQLENTLRHSREMSKTKQLEHQDLDQARREVGCSLFVGGENIAYTSEQGDIAKICVDMWENSPPHLKNILTTANTEVAVGFYRDNRQLLWCTQTFTVPSDYQTTGSPTDPGCKPVNEMMNKPSNDGPKEPTEPTTNEPKQAEMPEMAEEPKQPAMKRPTRKPTVNNTDARWADNRACRCIEKGRDCWHSLRKLSGDRCVPFQQFYRQPKPCVVGCCEYCRDFPSAPSCRSRNVRFVCKMF